MSQKPGIDERVRAYAANVFNDAFGLIANRQPAHIASPDDPSAEKDQAPTAQDLPRTWDEIAPGHLVIARETLECGWAQTMERLTARRPNPSRRDIEEGAPHGCGRVPQPVRSNVIPAPEGSPI